MFLFRYKTSSSSAYDLSIDDRDTFDALQIPVTNTEQPSYFFRKPIFKPTFDTITSEIMRFLRVFFEDFENPIVRKHGNAIIRPD
jgi:hypothetical protein